MSRYFARHWQEARGDRLEAWGTSDWFFETDDQGNVTRQIEVYANGPTRRYEREYPADDFGGLSTVPLDLDEFAPYATTQEAFDRLWRAH